LTSDKLLTAFRMFDVDGKDEITFKEMKDLLKVDDDVVKKIIATVDDSGDGKVQFDEF